MKYAFLIVAIGFQWYFSKLKLNLQALKLFFQANSATNLAAQTVVAAQHPRSKWPTAIIFNNFQTTFHILN